MTDFGHLKMIPADSPFAKGVVLLSASLLCLVLGSVHAFSVFLEPLEQQFAVSRSTASLAYSFALVCLTIAVLIGHKVFSAVRPGLFVSLVCAAAIAGCIVAASANTMPGVWLGYSLLFGGTNGLGYGFGLQISAQAYPGREGMAMGTVTACYALGASVSPGLFSWAVAVGGFQTAMLGLATIFALIAPICGGLLHRSGVRFQSEDKTTVANSVPARQVIWLWLGYGSGVTAGLMAIGHATGIAKVSGLQQGLWLAPVIIAIFNMAGSLAGGLLSDRIKQTTQLAVLSLVSTSALLVLALFNDIAVTMSGLGLIGFCYGAFIASFPAAVSKWFGVRAGTRIYGRVFTAWGTAGLFAPWLGGLLFDSSGDYSTALTIAAVVGGVSVVTILTTFPEQARHSPQQ